MKVLHINTYNTGGAAIACLRIHQALLNTGIDSKVLLRSKTENNIPEVYEIWEEYSFFQKIKKLAEQKLLEKKQSQLLPKKQTELFTLPQSIWDITQTRLYQEADIIHLHWVAGFIDYPTFFPKCNKPIIWTLHDYAPFSGGFHYPISTKIPALQQLQNLHLRLKEDVLKESNIHVVSPSNYLMEQSISSVVFGAFPHQQIPNCTSSNYQFFDQIQARKNFNIPLDKKIVLFVADQLDYKRKGFELLLNSIQQIQDNSILFYVIGEGATIENKQINHLGRITDEITLNQLYAAADLFVIPSLDDNLPNTITESLCSGTPVVGFNIGGIPEMINSSNGELCKKISSECLSQAIELNIKKDWNNVNISATALQKYNPETCVNSYLSIYNSARNFQ